MRHVHRSRSAALPAAVLLCGVIPAVAAAAHAPLLGPEMAAAFRDPPPRHRVLQIIHGFPDDRAAAERRVERLVARGFGGAVVNVAFDAYLRSEEKWDAFRAGVEAAGNAGLVLWLYDEDGYPSGAAGGLTLEGRPEWEARGLRCVVAETDGGRPLDIVLPPGRVVQAAAYPLRAGTGDLRAGVDLAGAVDAGGRLRWQRPGAWRVCAFVETRLREGTHAMANLYRPRPYPNLLEREATARFIAVTHAAYAARFAPLAERFPAIFTDEPSLMSVFLEASPQPAIPWAPGLPGVFRRAKGYDLLPALAALAADFGPEGRRVRCAFWDVIGREVAENYFGQIQDWCRAHGIASTGHLLAEEDLGSHVGFYGNFHACAARLDIPGIDCLTSDPATVPWHAAKLIGSLRCLNGAAEAMSETSDHAQRYRGPGDGRPVRTVTAEEILGTAHLLYVAGITTTTSYYSWAGLDDAAVARINAHIGRLGTVLAGAQHACDIAVLYPVESAWAHFVPQRLWAAAPGVARIDGIYRGVMTELFHAGRDVDVIDAAAVARAQVIDGTLAVGSERFRVLILPAVDVLPVAALERIAAFTAGGGILVAVGDLPRNDPARFPCKEACGIIARLFGDDGDGAAWEGLRMAARRIDGGGHAIYLPESSAWLLTEVLDRLLEQDVRFEAGLPLRVSRWVRPGGQVYFVINDAPRAIDAPVAFRAHGPIERWDPATGLTAAVAAGPDGRVRVTLPAYGAACFVFAAPRPPEMVAAQGERVAPVKVVSLLDAPAPRLLLSAPSHVHARLCGVSGGGDAAREMNDAAPSGLPVRVTADLAEGGIDSWCFLELRYEALRDLGGLRAIELLMRTPARQEACGARTFIILLEENEDGTVADYIADTHRGMGLSGLRRTSVPMGMFQLAGWSRDPDGGLDPARIRAIRVGWGGYHGKKGERIDFDLEGLNGLSPGVPPGSGAAGP